MRKTWLLQRLLRPWDKEGKLESFSNSLAFGGGLKNGGLPQNAMEILSRIFRFDYMGSAEFEFGALPQCLANMFATRETLIQGSLVVPWEYRDWMDREPVKRDKARMFYLCQAPDESELKIRIKKWAIGEIDKYLKENHLMPISLAGCLTEPIVGWLDLENGFFVFSDETMWRKTCELFGVKTPSKKKVKKG